MSVYFIRAGASDWIKIGHSKNPEERLADIQCGNHEVCTIEATLEGGRREEFQIHTFCDSPRRGEWFELSGLTLVAFEMAKSGKTLEAISREVVRLQAIVRAHNDERTARGIIAHRKFLADDPGTTEFHRRWLRMFGIKQAERDAEEEHKRVICRLAELKAVEELTK